MIRRERAARIAAENKIAEIQSEREAERRQFAEEMRLVAEEMRLVAEERRLIAEERRLIAEQRLRLMDIISDLVAQRRSR